MNKAQSNAEGGKLLAKFREDKGLTQIELATRAGKSRSMVAQLEIGERRPSRKIIEALARAMNLSKTDTQQLLVAYAFSPSGQTPEQIEAFLRADKNLSAEQAEKLAKILRETYNKYMSE